MGTRAGGHSPGQGPRVTTCWRSRRYLPSGPKASGVLFLETMGLAGSYRVEKPSLAGQQGTEERTPGDCGHRSYELQATPAEKAGPHKGPWAVRSRGGRCRGWNQGGSCQWDGDPDHDHRVPSWKWDACGPGQLRAGLAPAGGRQGQEVPLALGGPSPALGGGQLKLVL